jgi:hypothetical protein
MAKFQSAPRGRMADLRRSVRPSCRQVLRQVLARHRNNLF